MRDNSKIKTGNSMIAPVLNNGTKQHALHLADVFKQKPEDFDTEFVVEEIIKGLTTDPVPFERIANYVLFLNKSGIVKDITLGAHLSMPCIIREYDCDILIKVPCGFSISRIEVSYSGGGYSDFLTPSEFAQYLAKMKERGLV